jgi:hypothetical protein
MLMASGVWMNLGNSGSSSIDRRWESVRVTKWEDFWRRVSVILHSMPPGSHLLFQASDSPQVVDITADPPTFVVCRHGSIIYQRQIHRVDDIVSQMAISMRVHGRVSSPRELSFAFIGTAVERALRWLLVGVADPSSWKDLSTSAASANVDPGTSGLHISTARARLEEPDPAHQRAWRNYRADHSGSGTSGKASATVRLSEADQARLQHLRSALPEE